MLSKDEIQDAMDKADALLEGGKLTEVDRDYVNVVQETLGWVLGHYENPLSDY